jgi:hypothetical protein
MNSQREMAMEIEGPFPKPFRICTLDLKNERLETLAEADTLEEAKEMKARMRRADCRIGIFQERKLLDE